MALKREELSRRDFLKKAGVTGAAAVGIFAFPPGLEVVEAVAGGALRVTRSYSPVQVARFVDLTVGEPLDFSYPLEEQENFLVRLGVPAKSGIGLFEDVVAFSYLCSHMGCPLKGRYRHDHKMLGPCQCHFSRFDLTKNGTLILGQATQSLPQIVLELDDGMIYATGVTGLVYGFQNNLGGESQVKTT